MGKNCGNVACHDEDAPQVAPSKKEKGWNYTAIFLMMLFILPGIFAAVMQVSRDANHKMPPAAVLGIVVCFVWCRDMI
jgi:phosphotransferase system  glucose/maltose/N-acetylglucosamine-specific IIC component